MLGQATTRNVRCWRSLDRSHATYFVQLPSCVPLATSNPFPSFVFTFAETTTRRSPHDSAIPAFLFQDRARFSSPEDDRITHSRVYRARRLLNISLRRRATGEIRREHASRERICLGARALPLPPLPQELSRKNPITNPRPISARGYGFRQLVSPRTLYRAAREAGSLLPVGGEVLLYAHS